MVRGALAVIAAVVMLCLACAPAMCGRLYGEVTSVTEYSLTATFPAMIKPGSAMMVMSGKGESIAGMAISQTCEGEGPYEVTGYVSWISDPMNLCAGKSVYVNSLNASAIPSRRPIRVSKPRPKQINRDLGFYYYSAAEKVGYGTLGVGLEKSLMVGEGLAIELDGGFTGFGSMNDADSSGINTANLVKNLSGRLRLNLVSDFSVYAGYRWTEGSGSDDKWQQLTQELKGTKFDAISDLESGHVAVSGLEYGMVFGAASKGPTLALGYIPTLRTDYGGLGVVDDPAYTAELRFGVGEGGMRIRGVSAQDYWLVDLGITIK